MDMLYVLLVTSGGHTEEFQAGAYRTRYAIQTECLAEAAKLQQVSQELGNGRKFHCSGALSRENLSLPGGWFTIDEATLHRSSDIVRDSHGMVLSTAIPLRLEEAPAHEVQARFEHDGMILP